MAIFALARRFKIFRGRTQELGECYESINLDPTDGERVNMKTLGMYEARKAERVAHFALRIIRIRKRSLSTMEENSILPWDELQWLREILDNANKNYKKNVQSFVLQFALELEDEDNAEALEEELEDSMDDEDENNNYNNNAME